MQKIENGIPFSFGQSIWRVYSEVNLYLGSHNQSYSLLHVSENNNMAMYYLGLYYKYHEYSVYTRASNYESITSNHAVHNQLVVTGNTIEY